MLVIDIDSGKRVWANADDLYELSEDLIMLPAVVGKAALAGVTTRTLVTGVTPLLEEFSGKVGKRYRLYLLFVETSEFGVRIG